MDVNSLQVCGTRIRVGKKSWGSNVITLRILLIEAGSHIKGREIINKLVSEMLLLEGLEEV
jgi:hypothetical protein